MRLPEENIETPVSLSLEPYTGAWTKVQAAHLLRRTVLGPTFQQIQQTVADGMDATVAQLLTLPDPGQPLTFHPDETIAAYGSTWVNSVYPSGTAASAVNNARNYSMYAWIMGRLNDPVLSIREKMCLFWNNHFGAEATFDARAVYNLHELFRTHCLGNFRQLIKDVTVDVNMLLFLNGASNNQYSPNENYAREILELYTVGKGVQVGPGDYSHYTEADVAAGAKIFTGWTVDGLLSDTMTSPVAVYYPLLHDATVKTLSGYFGNASVVNADSLEYSNYIDIIFQQPDMAKFICRKIYRWFVNYDLTQEVEDTVIADLASTLEQNDFEILPVMEQLLKSDHFYDVSMLGTIIKNPIEHVFSMLNSTQSAPSYDLAVNSQIYLTLSYFTSVMGMDYYVPPSVGGWTAYYQAPAFSRLWANSSLIKLRFDLSTYLTVYTGIDVDGNNFKVDALTFLDGLSIPSDAPQVINDIADVFCPKGLTVAEKLTLKALLTNGLPDFEWTLQYNEYLADPGNTTYSDPVRQRVEFVLYRLFQMPEFQTI
jgi:uncharacterized protein (DUF1800 family)